MANLVIYKYPLPQSSPWRVSMPQGAEILSVQTQGNEPMLWVLCNPENNWQQRSFRILATGEPIDLEEARYDKYVGTFQLHGGRLVFHLFEIGGSLGTG